MVKCYFGTYSSDGGEGIYQAEFDTVEQKFSKTSLFCSAKNSKYLIKDNNYIVTLFEGQQASGVAIYDLSGILLDMIEYEQTTSCYITKHGNDLYTVNYNEGTITKLKFENNKLSLINQKLIQEKAGCHQVIIYNDMILLPCLLLDKLYILDKELNILEFIEFPLGTGPRHGVLSLDQTFLYLVGELNDTLYTFSIQNNSLIKIHEIPLLSEDSIAAKATAAIRISDDGQTLFISIRNANRVVMVDISNKIPKIIQYISSIGDHPRDILNILNDKYLIVANRTDGKIIMFPIENNKILEACSEISINGAVSICVV